MAMSGGKDDGEPMGEMNTTPLIDVMLVLLIMFIITIPVATHAVNIDLPTPSDQPNDSIIKPDKNKVVITPDNKILWNAVPIDYGTLRSNLKATLAIKPEPELQFEPDAQAGYEIAANTLNIIKNSEVTKFGFVGNERYAGFNRAEGTPKPN